MRVSARIAATLALLAALVLGGGTATASTLQGSLLNGAPFPSRGIVLWNSSTQRLNPRDVSVSENGHAVSDLSVTPLSQAARGVFGTELVLDTAMNMSGAPIAQEMQAVRELAAQRGPDQQLGIITYSSSPQVMLPLSSDQPTIAAVTGRSPWISPGDAAVLPALTLALSQVSAAHLVTGSVVIVSDGAAGESAAAAAKLAAEAHADGIRVFTVGVQDAHSTQRSLAELKALGGGTFVETSPSQLPTTLRGVWASLNSGYIIHYQSNASAGQKVTVDLRVAGVPGLATASYAAPATPSPFSGTSTPLPLPTAPAAHGKAIPPVLVALIVGTLIAVAIILLVAPHSRQGVQRRVENFIAPEAQTTSAVPGEAPPEGGGFARLLHKASWWPEFVLNIEVARIRKTPDQVVKRTAAGVLVLAVLLTMMLGSALFAFLVIAVAPFAMLFVVRRLAKRQRARFTDQLPAYLQDMAGAMRAGRSVVGAIAAVADGANEPIKGEFERALADERLGLPLEETLHAIATRMQSEDFEQVVLVAALNRRSGSNVAEAFDRVAEGARERADMRRELAALTGQARISSWVLTALPPILLVAMKFIDPKYVAPLFHTGLGIVVLAFCVILVLSGRFVMNKIVNVEV